MIRWLFHACCAAVLALSIVFATTGAGSRPQPKEPKAQLERFLVSNGLKQTSAQELLSGATMYEYARTGCTTPVTVLYLPVIHRISDVARGLAEHQTAILVHDGSIVSDLSGTTLIPRWLWRRLLVNFQIFPEDPWISIALAVQDPAGCLPKDVDWGKLVTF